MCFLIQDLIKLSKAEFAEHHMSDTTVTSDERHDVINH